MIGRCRRIIALVLLATFANLVPVARACGPSSIDPIFVFTSSPDIPFAQFARANLGIVRPTFGRKTLFIAYRYLNSNWFSDDEQTALINALKGTAPEDDGTAAVKAWVAARKEILTKEETPRQFIPSANIAATISFPTAQRTLSKWRQQR